MTPSILYQAPDDDHAEVLRIEGTIEEIRELREMVTDELTAGMVLSIESVLDMTMEAE